MTDAKGSSHLYVNVAIANPITATAAIPCVMSQSFGTGPLVDDTSRFKASIVRFTLPISALPYFQCAPVVNANGLRLGTALQKCLNVGSINQNITQGTVYTTLSVVSWTQNLGVGTQIWLDSNFDTLMGPVTLSAAALAGSTSISINSWTAPQSGISLNAMFVVPTPFKLTLQYNGASFWSYVNLVQWTSNASDWNVYFVNQFIDSVNTALNIAYTAVVAANPTAYQLFAGHQPYIQFNSSSNLCTVVTDVGAWEITAPNSPAIYFNTALMNVFAQLPNTFNAFNSAAGTDNQLRIVNRPGNLTTVVFAGQGSLAANTILNAAVTQGTVYTSLTTTAFGLSLPSGIVLNLANSFTNVNNNIVLSAPVTAGATSISIKSWMATSNFGTSTQFFYYPPQQILTTDEAPSVASWWNTQSIAVTSNQLPARTEILPSAVQGQYDMQPIISDFVITPQERLAASTDLLYLPTAQYRWFDLMGLQNLRQLDLTFWATDGTGLRQNWQQIMIAPGENGSAKLLLQCKCVLDEKLDDEAESGGSFVRSVKRARLF